MNLFQILRCINSLRKAQEKEFHILLTDTAYSKVSNKYLKSYDPKQKPKYIKYLDTNNLYGYAMSKFLQASGFKWLDPKEFGLNKYASNTSEGCVLEVNLEYLEIFFAIVSIMRTSQ